MRDEQKHMKLAEWMQDFGISRDPQFFLGSIGGRQRCGSLCSMSLTFEQASLDSRSLPTSVTGIGDDITPPS